MSTRRWAILITGLVLLLIGGFFLFLGAQSPNPISSNIGVFFTLFGTATNYLQLFFSFPVGSNRLDVPAPTQAPPPRQVPAQASGQVPPPTSSVLMYIRLSGVVLIIGDVIFAAIGLLPYSLYTQSTFISSIYLILGITILLCLLLYSIKRRVDHFPSW